MASKRHARKASKDYAIRVHARRRAQSRFGLSSYDLLEIAALIREGNTDPVEKQSNRVTVHRLTYQGQEMQAVYDKIRSVVVTVLYPDDDPRIEQEGKWPL